MYISRASLLEASASKQLYCSRELHFIETTLHLSQQLSIATTMARKALLLFALLSIVAAQEIDVSNLLPSDYNPLVRPGGQSKLLCMCVKINERYDI